MADSKPAFLKEIGDCIECPVCLSPILDPPVFMCVRSHIFCKDCHTTLKKDNQSCPVCKGDLAGNKNIPIERILDTFPKTCCKNQGCSYKKVDSKKVEGHHDVCQYRPVKCLECRKSVPLIDVCEHLWNEHECPKDRKREFGRHYSWYSPLVFSSGSSVPLVMEDEGKKQVFFLNSLEHADGHHLYWISQSQSKKDIQRYKYTISLLCAKAYRDEEKIKRLVTYSGLCLPVDVNMESVSKDIPCLSLPKLFLQKNVDEDNNYHFESRVDIID